MTDLQIQNMIWDVIKQIDYDLWKEMIDEGVGSIDDLVAVVKRHMKRTA